MTEERNDRNTDTETDAAVTQAYRDTANERTPESLNRAILERAAKAARPRYSQLRLWTRPMAWAATVMLSVAIVLQLTQIPAPESVRFDDSVHDVEAPAAAANESLEEAVVPASAAKIETLRSSAKELAPGALSEARQRPEQAKASVADQDAAITESELKFSSQDMLQRTTVGAVNEPTTPSACDETATAAAESWLQCITDMEAAGLGDAARAERRLLAAAFPDFNTP